jgi:lia operon protein LiaG
MSIDDRKYYARISHSGNKILVEKGRRPFGIGTGILFNVFSARVEVYIPMSYTRKIVIETTSGKIESEGELFFSGVNIKSSSGNISVDIITADAVSLRASSGHIRGGTINGNTNIHTSSGDIIFDSINGNVSVKASSGRIALKCVTGSVMAETTSGNIQCMVTETAGDIALTASSGGIALELPRNHNFNFSARTSSGHISAPFSDKLFSPISDRHLAQGVIGNEITSNNNSDINIRTNSGSIKIDWVN